MLRLCPIGMAEHPYHIKSIDYNFYSLEELFIYYNNNEILIDESIMEEDFIFWIRQNKENRLADKLTQILKGQGSLTMFLEAMLEYVNIYSEDEKQEFLRKVSFMEHKNLYEKRKVLADQMLERGKYESAILEYYRILDSNKNAYSEEEFLSKVWHNLGCCYGHLFNFDESINAFQKALSYRKNEETLEAVDTVLNLIDRLKGGIKVERNDSGNFLNLITRSNDEERKKRYNDIDVRLRDYLRSTI